MTVKINYSNKKISVSSSNLILFSNDVTKTSGVKNLLTKDEFSYINDLLKTSDLKKIY